MRVKKKVKGYLLTIVGSIILILIYQYSKPRYYAINKEAKNLPAKVRPIRDSTYIYIPYQLTIYNNRINNLKLSHIYDGNPSVNRYGKYLLYNLDNLELTSFRNGSAKIIEEKNQQKYGNDSYWRYKYTFKYANNIFPFLSRKFIYYKRYTLSNKNNRFQINEISRDSIKKQLYTLDYNIITNIEKYIVDSLYKANSNKRFNIYFESEHLVTKKIRAKINTEEQEIIYLNLYDSIKGMDIDKEETKGYLLELINRRHSKDMF